VPLVTSRNTQWTALVEGRASRPRPRSAVSGGVRGPQGATRVRVGWRQSHAVEETRLKSTSGWRRALLGCGACPVAGRAPGRPAGRSVRRDVIAQPSADLVTRRLYHRRLTSDRRCPDRDYPGVGHNSYELSATGGVTLGRRGGIQDATSGRATHRFRRTPRPPFAGGPRGCGRPDTRQAHHARRSAQRLDPQAGWHD
jgi:hypothetical protein